MQDGWSLTAGDAALHVIFELEEPSQSQLYCGTSSPDGLSFAVRATLRSDALRLDMTTADSDAGTAEAGALQRLDAETVFVISARADATATELLLLQFVRRDVQSSLTRAQLETATGLVIDVPEEYETFWWSWHGTLTQAAGDPWQRRGAFQVNSLDAAQMAEVERVIALGGPPAGISYDGETGWPVLPGDKLVDATLETP